MQQFSEFGQGWDNDGRNSILYLMLDTELLEWARSVSAMLYVCEISSKEQCSCECQEVCLQQQSGGLLILILLIPA